MSTAEFHPVQTRERFDRRPGQARTEVTLRAYEVYCALWGEQKALVTGGCRGGFGTGELVALLYARTFPREEWRKRFDEAVEGLVI